MEGELLGYHVVVVLRGRDGELASRDHYPLEEAEAELARLEEAEPGDGRLVRMAGMLVDPKDVKAAFLREEREDLIAQLARRSGS
jgi:hypothetical protein